MSKKAKSYLMSHGTPVIENIRSGEQLTDDVISEACRILAVQFPAM